MNAVDILRYGHRTVKGSVAGLSEEDWRTQGVAGYWTVKDMIGHLASFEQLLIEVLGSVLEDRGMPTVERFRADPDRFNTEETTRRRELSAAEVWEEYESAHEQTLALVARVPEEMRRQAGLLPWYGPEYDLEDFIVYTFYGHKREHSAHISLFRDHKARRT